MPMKPSFVRLHFEFAGRATFCQLMQPLEQSGGRITQQDDALCILRTMSTQSPPAQSSAAGQA
ncbi:hypothetical protein EMIT0111MI5_110067 [Burkholderia sp. IT-111MI5]